MGEKFKEIIQILYNSILEVVYPYEYKCIICEAEEFIGICPCCKNKIAVVEKQEEILSYGYYGGILKELIFKFKYKNNFTAGKVLSDLLGSVIEKQNIEIDLICYVPMSKKSIRKRGYNQCEIMAKNLSRKFKVPVCDCIRKIRETEEQKKLCKSERITNISGAFKIENTEKIKGRNVLLIDDVVTTGATLNECIKLFKKSDINRITVLTIAKTNI